MASHAPCYPCPSIPAAGDKCQTGPQYFLRLQISHQVINMDVAVHAVPTELILFQAGHPSYAQESSKTRKMRSNSIADYECDRAAYASGQTPSPMMPDSAAGRHNFMKAPNSSAPRRGVPKEKAENSWKRRPITCSPDEDFSAIVGIAIDHRMIYLKDVIQSRDWKEIFRSIAGASDHQMEFYMTEDRGHYTPRDPHIEKVLGTSLGELNNYMRSAVKINGYVHDLPKLIFTCVEEILRTRIHKDGLFYSSPNIDHLRRLETEFDQMLCAQPMIPMDEVITRPSKHPKYRRKICIRKLFGQDPEAELEVMLAKFLEYLPDPVIGHPVQELFYEGCSEPTRQREERKQRLNAVDPPNSLLDIVREEAHQIELARILLQYLLPSHLSLLAYLFQFFQQIPYSKENHVSLEVIAEKFYLGLLGKGTEKEKGMYLVRWLLERWEIITDDMPGLLDPSSSDEHRRSLLRRAHSEVHSQDGAPHVSQESFDTQTQFGSYESDVEMHCDSDIQGITHDMDDLSIAQERSVDGFVIIEQMDKMCV